MEPIRSTQKQVNACSAAPLTPQKLGYEQRQEVNKLIEQAQIDLEAVLFRLVFERDELRTALRALVEIGPCYCCRESGCQAGCKCKAMTPQPRAEWEKDYDLTSFLHGDPTAYEKALYKIALLKRARNSLHKFSQRYAATEHANRQASEAAEIVKEIERLLPSFGYETRK